jgi:hypothetical protein
VDERNGATNDDIYTQKLEANRTGKAHIFYGGNPMDNTADLNLIGENKNDKFGYSIHNANDINNDGDPDVIVGAPYYDKDATNDTGAIYVFFGGSGMDATPDLTKYGQYANDHFGWSVSYALAFNGSGNKSVIVGAPRYNTQAGETPPSASDAGKVYIYSSESGEVIPEFEEIAIPITFSLIIFAVLRRKPINNSKTTKPLKSRDRVVKKNKRVKKRSANYRD